MPAKKSSGKPAKKSAPRASNKRELITPHKGDSRYVKRGAGGQFKKSAEVQDRAKKAKKTVPSD